MFFKWNLDEDLRSWIEVQKGLNFQTKQNPGDELEDIIEQLRKFPEVNPGHPPGYIKRAWRLSFKWTFSSLGTSSVNDCKWGIQQATFDCRRVRLYSKIISAWFLDLPIPLIPEVIPILSSFYSSPYYGEGGCLVAYPQNPMVDLYVFLSNCSFMGT